MNKVFFFTDIHGMGNLYDAIMKHCIEQDPECIIVFGGDACDRGKDGYRIMKDLLNHPNVVYLKGNHEDIFVKAARQIKQKMPNLKTKEEIGIALTRCKRAIDDYGAIALSLYNGGKSTLTDWILDGMPMDIVEKLDNLQLTFVYDNYDFSHSAGKYKNFQKVHQLELRGQPIADEDAEYLLWTRSDLDAPWAQNRVAVFGHTPVMEVYRNIFDEIWPANEAYVPIMYASEDQTAGWKICMDTYACVANRAFVFDVLEERSQGFEQKNDGTIEKIEVI